MTNQEENVDKRNTFTLVMIKVKTDFITPVLCMFCLSHFDKDVVVKPRADAAL